ncbi:hypothetical protein SMD11_6177 [Streptomyces albireticuli]|uniref:Cholesterol esterase n=1 Tax=Streptomyces albireticuli TaxID=1940 RepID=A0A1Z2LBR7_9ACTN|nr:hypothetical protein [Streptomyces albireticuli]ARZ71753.1 hypothetical protein SMD11_6177 [Streptomyces albireticuli]
MKIPLARLAALVALPLAVVVPASVSAQEADPVLPPLQLRGGTPFAYCLTDTAAEALRGAGFTFDAVAPATLGTENGHQCMKATLENGQINTDLTGLTGSAKGGFALRKGGKRAEFAALQLRMKLDRTGTITAEHLGKRIDTLTTSGEGIKTSLTRVSAENTPVNLAPAAADALTAEFGTSPLSAGQQLFSGTAGFDVLQGVTGLPTGK